MFTLFYLGFVSDLNTRVLSLQIQNFVDIAASSTNATSAFVQEIQSVNTSLAVVQILLLYLLKVPYHLLQNNLGIIRIRVYEGDFDRVRALSVASHLEQSRLARSLENVDPSGLSMESLNSELRRHSIRSHEKESTTTFKWRVLPSKPEFVTPGEPFEIDEEDNVGGALFGKKYAKFVVWLFLYEVFCQIFLTIQTLFSLPAYWLVLVGVLDKNWTYIGIFTCYLMILQLLCGNVKATKLLLKQGELRLFALLLLVGSIGFADAFSYDIRTFGIFTLNFAVLAVTAFADARIRVKPVTILFTMFYFYGFYM